MNKIRRIPHLTFSYKIQNYNQKKNTLKVFLIKKELYKPEIISKLLQEYEYYTLIEIIIYKDISFHSSRRLHYYVLKSV